MRIAIPLTNEELSQHFGHCEQFAIIDVDSGSKSIQNKELFVPPAHEPGVLPKWLNGLCVNTVITGGMGKRARELFTQNQIEVVVGATADNPENLVSAYLAGTLEVEENMCDH